MLVKFVLRRGVWAIFTIFAVVTFVFFALRASGDPTLGYLPQNHTPAQRQAMMHRIGTDKSVFDQYWLFLKHTATGDLGRSIKFNTNATALVGDRLPATLKLAVVAFLLSLVVSVPLGVVAGTYPGSPIDLAIRAFSATGQAVPSFVIAMLLVLLFSVELKWLPVTGSDSWRSYILPAVSLSWFSIATTARIARSAIMTTMQQDFIRTARAKGLGAQTIGVRHAFRNAAVPILTVIGLTWPAFAGGAIVIETVFAWPGLGRLLLEGASNRDYAVVQTSTMVISFIFIVANLCTDVGYLIVDPRLR